MLQPFAIQQMCETSIQTAATAITAETTIRLIVFLYLFVKHPAAKLHIKCTNCNFTATNLSLWLFFLAVSILYIRVCTVEVLCICSKCARHIQCQSAQSKYFLHSLSFKPIFVFFRSINVIHHFFPFFLGEYYHLRKTFKYS